ncbi:tyrosine phosphatase family-domain-containing protein [Podospora aff. communis PSN243]|uniref:diphosphoinositol-polyphosphate diphosphatase n=1 Tax=Podospora aff. communis PSN243 TaxID=3040156 RepID=A0AAV9GVY1_9PEZI|nr:tyrosine phosphatase family-domain-containing protein [Podospora aff. communis PSN243]
MTVGIKAVSKRSARMYVEDEGENNEKDGSRQQLRRASAYEDTVVTAISKNSICTANSQTTLSSQSSRQTSLEVSPSISAVRVDQKLDIAPSDSGALLQEKKSTYPGAIEMFASVQEYAAFSNPGDETLPAAGRPLNFGVVVPGVYRSSFPQAEDYAFVEALKLKTVVTLVQKDFPEGYHSFISKNGIKHHVFDMKGTKKQEIPIKTMKSILRLVLDRQNHPLLMHCNHGRHRTGCVVAVVRKVSGWDLGPILKEYRSFAEPKVRDCDINYITGFELAEISNLFKNSGWQFRTRNFIRATVFALFVLVIWLCSGVKMAGAPKRKLEK